MFTAGIMLSDDICLLMLIRYGGPKLQMDFVSFLLLMLRAENTESELLESREGGASSVLLVDCPILAGSRRTAASAERAGTAGSVPASPGCICSHSLAPCLLQKRRFEAAHL